MTMLTHHENVPARASRRIWPGPQRRNAAPWRTAGTKLVAAINAAAAALELARSHRHLRIDVFEPDWLNVDQLREQVRQEGLAGRVRIRIIDALSMIDQSDYDLVLSRPHQVARSEA